MAHQGGAIEPPRSNTNNVHLHHGSTSGPQTFDRTGTETGYPRARLQLALQMASSPIATFRLATLNLSCLFRPPRNHQSSTPFLSLSLVFSDFTNAPNKDNLVRPEGDGEHGRKEAHTRKHPIGGPDDGSLEFLDSALRLYPPINILVGPTSAAPGLDGRRLAGGWKRF